MTCSKCPLNIKSKNFTAKMYEAIPVHAKALFVCKNSKKTGDGDDLFMARQICARDLWVLSFIGSKENFAVKMASATFDKLIAGGHAELLCHLFENASYETRKDLWARMVNHYPDRLYMFDALFEKECLAPVDSDNMPENLHIYRHYLLYAGGSAHVFMRDL